MTLYNYVQGYLTYKKTHPPRTKAEAYAQGDRVVLVGRGVAYERGNPVQSCWDVMPLRSFRFFSQHRRTPELVLQKSHASFLRPSYKGLYPQTLVSSGWPEVRGSE